MIEMSKMSPESQLEMFPISLRLGRRRRLCSERERGWAAPLVDVLFAKRRRSPCYSKLFARSDGAGFLKTLVGATVALCVSCRADSAPGSFVLRGPMNTGCTPMQGEGLTLIEPGCVSFEPNPDGGWFTVICTIKDPANPPKLPHAKLSFYDAEGRVLQERDMTVEVAEREAREAQRVASGIGGWVYVPEFRVALPSAVVEQAASFAVELSEE